MSEHRALGSRYRLLEQIGRGSMGEVWRGVDDTGRTLAFKVLHASLGSNPDLVNRFLSERRLLTGVRHPNVVAVQDLVAEGSTLAIVMEFVEGSDLRGRLKQSGTLPPAEAARIVGEIARGLATIHDQKIFHRDIKPENILLDSTTNPQTARITDFGVAKLAAESGANTSTMLVGTPNYLAPELADGGAPSIQSDLYSLGILAYELMTGVTPFQGPSTMAVLRGHGERAPGRPGGLPNAAWDMIVWMLHKQLGERPGSARDVEAAMERLAESVADAPQLAPLSEPPAGEMIAGPGLTTVSGRGATAAGAAGIAGAAGMAGAAAMGAGGQDDLGTIAVPPSAVPYASHPGGSHPGASYPGSSQPGASYPGASQPGASYPPAGYPGNTFPGNSQPGAPYPGMPFQGPANSYPGGPGSSYPGGPGASYPGPGASYPGPGGSYPGPGGAYLGASYPGQGMPGFPPGPAGGSSPERKRPSNKAPLIAVVGVCLALLLGGGLFVAQLLADDTQTATPKSTPTASSAATGATSSGTGDTGESQTAPTTQSAPRTTEATRQEVDGPLPNGSVPDQSSASENDAARAQLTSLRSQSQASTSLNGRYVLQLDSKWEGVTDPKQTASDGSHTFQARDILARHESLKASMASQGVPVLMLAGSDFGEQRISGKGIIWTTLADPGNLDSMAEARSACSSLFPGLSGKNLENACLPRTLTPPH